jgi:hypothetical protein
MKIVRRQPVVPWFLGTRLVMLLLALDLLKYFNRVAVTGDVRLYDSWITGSFRHGQFPLHDHKWQYPPGAAGPLLLPKLFANSVIPGSYFVAFFVMCLAADGVVFWLLLRAARASEPVGSSSPASAAGPWLWTLGVASIGPMAYGRYDLVVTALAVAALCVTLKAERATLITRGALIGIGAFIKVWPAAILFGAPRGRRGRWLAGSAAVTLLLPTIGLQLAFPGVLSFLTNQKSRGIQIESVFATPFLVGHWFGLRRTVVNSEYGAYEYTGAGTALASTLAVVATAIGFALLLWIRRRAARAYGPSGFPLAMLPDVALAATLVAVVTSRVLSPQYLVWILGLGAVCLTRRDTVQKTPAWVILGAVSVTQLIFPLFYHSMRGGEIFSGLILVGRNGALVAAAVLALAGLWKATAGGPGPASEPSSESAEGSSRSPSMAGSSQSAAGSVPSLAEDVLPPLGGEVLAGGAEHAPEGLVDRVGGPARRGADGLVEGD